MDDKIKPFMQTMLQLRLDGKLSTVEDMVDVICTEAGNDQGIEWSLFFALAEWVPRLMPCDNIPAAKAFAEQHGLTVVV